MKLLLDTHCWLWMQTAPERFSDAVREHLENPETQLFLSAAGSWEIAIKYALGKLPLPTPPAEYVPSRLAAGSVLPIEISHSHALEAAQLPEHHRDPFDRLLIAQARLERLTLLTADQQLGAYDVEILPAV